jgi:hypothetical protein
MDGPGYFFDLINPGSENNSMAKFFLANRSEKMSGKYATKRPWPKISSFLFTTMLACILSMSGHTACFASTIKLQWGSSSGASGYKVYYQADSSTLPFSGTGASEGSAPIDVLNNTNATISGLDPEHAYYFTVTAYNDTGESAYSNIVSVPELVSPTIALSYPANNASVSGTVSVTSVASDNVGVTKVEFYVNGVLQSTDTASPYLFSWNTSSLSSGNYTLTAKAYDAAGNVGQATAVSVTVVNDTTAPTVSLTAPASNNIVSGIVAITASANDNVGVSKVEFYGNGVLLSASNVSPYSYNWNTTSFTNGSYTLSAKAYDSSGNVGQSSNVSVTVNNPDSTAPSVSLTAPANSSIVSGTVSVAATASDNIGVSKVEFYVNNVLQATDTSSPYSLSWNTTLVANGSYTLSAKAYDAAGNVGSSANVSVTVNNHDATAPTVSVTSPSAGATVNGTVAVTATANDNIGVSKVEFYVNNALQATDTSSPYSLSWNTTLVANGAYTLSAKVYDAAGNVGSSTSISVTVNNPDTTAPTVSAFTLPATATTLTVPISTFTATDNIGVTGYCVTTTNSPAGCIWSGTKPAAITFGIAGSQTAWAWARDAAGNTSAGVSASTSITTTGSSSITIGETSILSGDDSGNGNLLLAQSATLGQTATIQSLSFYVTTASGNLRLGVYDATGTNGGPGNLIASTAELTPVTGWNTANVTNPASLKAGTYWLAFLPSSGNLHCGHIYETGVATWYSYTYGTMPSAFPTSQSAMTAHWSFYATLITNNDSTAPNVSISAPSAGATVNGSVSVTTSASDNIGVTKVELYVNNVLQATDSAAPYSFSWNTTSLANGSYTLSVKAYDAAGNIGSSTNVSVTVNNPDTTAPTVSIVSTINNSTINGTQTITVSASDNIGVSKVEFYINNVLQATDTASPYSFSWNTTSVANGLYTLSAKAYDAANNIGQSANMTVTVSNSSPAPTVSIISPINGATYNGSATITLTASATANGTATITRVEFYNGANLLNTVSSSPYSYTWSNVATGTYTFTAKAYDSTGAVSISSPVNVNVVSPVKTVTMSAGSPTSPSPVGTSVTFNASASGGSGSYQYKFMVKIPGSGWATEQVYSSNSSFTWKTTGLTAGTYNIQVWARNAGSTGSFDAWKAIKYVLK